MGQVAREAIRARNQARHDASRAMLIALKRSRMYVEDHHSNLVPAVLTLIDNAIKQAEDAGITTGEDRD